MTPRRSILVLVLISFLPAVRLQAGCSPIVAVQVPATACKSGTATAGVMAVPGATYAWTVDGGQIAGDASGDHIAITLGTTAKATASVTLTSGDCVSHGSSVIALQDPFGVRLNTIVPGRAGEPLTIVWTYDNGAPGQQTISGEFGTLALATDVRSYTYTPPNSGSKQFVIDGAMKTPASTAPPPSRQRAVSKSPVSASPCTLAHAAAAYTVSECVIPVVAIDAPTSAVSDATFDLTVQHQAGAVAAWTITNGFPATATGDKVTITAGSSGQVGVTVRLTRGACTDSGGRSIAITAKPACDSPKAAVTIDPLSCGSGFLHASFTGTPPFRGLWSDNVPFETSNTSIVRPVTIPGTYSIKNFWDSICEGTSTSVAVVPAIPTATISGKANSCTGIDTVTARFTGKPPFSGCWNDGDCFQTNQPVLTKLITKTGTNTLAYGVDGTGCALTINGAVQTSISQHVGLSKRCEWAQDIGNYANFYLFYDGVTTGPSVTWSDGVKTGNARFGIHPSQTTTYTVTGISEGGACATIWDTPRSITIYPTPVPEFTPDGGDRCFGSIATATLATPPPPGATVEWTVQAGTLISGQGTNSIQYQVGQYISGYPTNALGVISTFTFAGSDRCPLSTQSRHRVVPVEPYGSLNLHTGAELRAGKTYYFTFEVGWDITDWSVTNSMNDTITVPAVCASSDYCTATYTSTHGPGKSTVTLHAKNACKTKDFSAEITILP